MSIRTLLAIKNAEELSISMVKDAKKEADRQVDQSRRQEEQKQQKKMEDTLLHKQDIMLEARKRADVQCSRLENENQSILEKYESPSEIKVQEVVNLVVKRVLMYGN